MTPAAGATGAQAILRVLAGMGVEQLFASPGSEWAPLWEALARAEAKSLPAPRYLSVRHEEVAVGMASGYAKASGLLPGVMLHTTVGVQHAAMGLRGARHERVPMVVFAGESAAYGEGDGPDAGAQWLPYLQDIGGPAAMIERCVKWASAVTAPALLPGMVARACHLARAAPAGPAFLSVPMEMLFSVMTSEAPSIGTPSPQPTADPAAIEELAEILAGASRPVIVAEEAGRNAQIVTSIALLAERLGAPVVETRSTRYLNLPRDHAMHGGFEPADVVRDADAVLLLGVIAPWHPASARMAPGATVALMSDDPLHSELAYWGFHADLIVTGDIGSSVASLAAAVELLMVGREDAVAARREVAGQQARERNRAWDDAAEGLSDRDPIDARWVAYELGRRLPPDAAVVEEVIVQRISLHRYLRRLRPGRWFAGAIGGLGTGLATALGVKVAYPDRPVVCAIGDGSFNYDPALAALGAAQEHRLPILIIIFDDGGYGSQWAKVPRYFPDGHAVRRRDGLGMTISPSPDYALIARAFDGHGELVEDPRQVGPAIDRGLRAVEDGRLSLLDMRIAPV